MNVDLDTPVNNMSMSQRIIGTFLSPRAVFEDIACSPSWLPVLIFTCIIDFGFSLLCIPKMKEFMLITMQSQTPTIPEASAALAVKMSIISLAVVGVLTPVIYSLIAAGLLKFTNMFSGEPTPYRRFFAVSVYGYLPALIASVLGSILITLTPAANLQEVSTSLYLLFPPGSTGFAANLARQINPFSLWSIVLVSMGGAVISRGKVKSYAISMFTIWAIFAVGSALLTKL